jgi:uncharacterized small protein (DUF1192 family)
MKLVKLFAYLLFFLLSVILCAQIVSHSLSSQQLKNDYAELNHIKYGLLSIEEWNRRIVAILDEEINKLELSNTNQRELRKQIETVLGLLIDQIDKNIREANSSSSAGRFKQSIIESLISVEDIKKGIPEYADTVMRELTKARTMGRVRAMLIDKLNQYSRRTFDKQDTAQISEILLRTGYQDIESARTGLKKAISENRSLLLREAMLLILLSAALFLLTGFSRKPLSPCRYILLVSSLVLLLIAGVITPMIDLEAKISQLDFVLMGHSVHFENQVLYFQSKSILDVFWILITNQDIPMKFVGVLLVTFSTIFPVMKILSAMAYYYDYRGAKENPVIRFFVFKSGKWSMADVMVVAMFMAYIGFNGVINNQLEQLRQAGQQLDILTTNGTSLQPGYYLFLAYCLLGLFLSEFIIRKSQAPELTDL